MSTWQSAVCGALAVSAIVSDVYSRRVSNVALLAALLAGVAIQVLLGDSADPRPPQALLGLVAGLVFFLPFYVFRWMGAGDVKLMAAIGFLLGLSALLPIWALSCLTLTLHSIAALAAHRLRTIVQLTGSTTGCHGLISRLGRRVHRARQGRQGMPYAAHIGICTLVWLSAGGIHAV